MELTIPFVFEICAAIIFAWLTKFCVEGSPWSGLIFAMSVFAVTRFPFSQSRNSTFQALFETTFRVFSETTFALRLSVFPLQPLITNSFAQSDQVLFVSAVFVSSHEQETRTMEQAINAPIERISMRLRVWSKKNPTTGTNSSQRMKVYFYLLRKSTNYFSLTCFSLSVRNLLRKSKKKSILSFLMNQSHPIFQRTRRLSPT